MSKLPLLTAQGRTLPEAWERSLIALGTMGQLTRSQHHPKGEEGTLDCTMVMTVDEPLAEPRIHRCLPGGLDDLWIYVEEVLNGVRDHWINPAAGQWSYTYHQRLTDYQGVDQVARVLDILTESPHTRRAQGITWIPSEDIGSADPPCLQRVWLRLIEIEEGYSLVMNCHWRSRDALKAAFMNLFALSEFQRRSANTLAERLDRSVTCGRLVDISDSYHLYQGYTEEWRAFWRSLSERGLVERTFTTDFAEPFREIARQRLAEERAMDGPR